MNTYETEAESDMRRDNSCEWGAEESTREFGH